MKADMDAQMKSSLNAQIWHSTTYILWFIWNLLSALKPVFHSKQATWWHWCPLYQNLWISAVWIFKSSCLLVKAETNKNEKQSVWLSISGIHLTKWCSEKCLRARTGNTTTSLTMNVIKNPSISPLNRNSSQNFTHLGSQTAAHWESNIHDPTIRATYGSVTLMLTRGIWSGCNRRRVRQSKHCGSSCSPQYNH